MTRILAALETYARDVAPTLGEHPLLSPPTLSVGTIQGGVSVNTVPDHCEIEIDHRVLPGQDPLELRQQTIDFVTAQIPDSTKVTFAEPNITAPGLSDQHKRQLGRVACGNDSITRSFRPVDWRFLRDRRGGTRHGRCPNGCLWSRRHCPSPHQRRMGQRAATRARHRSAGCVCQKHRKRRHRGLARVVRTCSGRSFCGIAEYDEITATPTVNAI